jgi:hypothetical protein
MRSTTGQLNSSPDYSLIFLIGHGGALARGAAGNQQLYATGQLILDEPS